MHTVLSLANNAQSLIAIAGWCWRPGRPDSESIVVGTLDFLEGLLATRQRTRALALLRALAPAETQPVRPREAGFGSELDSPGRSYTHAPTHQPTVLGATASEIWPCRREFVVCGSVSPEADAIGSSGQGNIGPPVLCRHSTPAGAPGTGRCGSFSLQPPGSGRGGYVGSRARYARGRAVDEWNSLLGSIDGARERWRLERNGRRRPQRPINAGGMHLRSVNVVAPIRVHACMARVRASPTVLNVLTTHADACAAPIVVTIRG